MAIDNKAGFIETNHDNIYNMLNDNWKTNSKILVKWLNELENFTAKISTLT